MDSLVKNEKTKTPLVSVYTCVYNMADKIHRALNSVKAQTYRNIEHVIVNDGSTDGVEKILSEYKNSAAYPVIIVNKENGGKHTALNAAYSAANGEFFIQIDADDELTPHAVSFLIDTYFSIPEDERDKFWCVHGRCKTQTGKFVGDKYPDDINGLPFKKQKKVFAKISGEKIGLQKAAVLKQYPFPEPELVKLVDLNVVWSQINAKYKTYYTNEIVRVYYVDEGGNLSEKTVTERKADSFCWSSAWFMNNGKISETKTLPYAIKYALFYPYTSAKFKKEYPYFKGFGFSVKTALFFLKLFKPFYPFVLKRKGYRIK